MRTNTKKILAMNFDIFLKRGTIDLTYPPALYMITYNKNLLNAIKLHLLAYRLLLSNISPIARGGRLCFEKKTKDNKVNI
jgi:hypothetical protein